MSESGSRHRSSTDLEIAQRKIFIGGLSYSTDDDKLRKYFGAYGSVQDAVVMKDPVSRRSRGFGFITFCEIESVDNVLDNEPHTIDLRRVEAKRAVPRSEVNREAARSAASNAVGKTGHGVNAVTGHTSGSSGPSTPTTLISSSPASSLSANSGTGININDYAYNKVFVGGLHYDTRDAEFKAYFEKFGKVVTAEVMFNRETHKSRGFGFIVYEVERSAELVCIEKEHVIDGKVVEVKRAIPRNKIGAGAASPSPSPSPSSSTPTPPSKGAGGVGASASTGAGASSLQASSTKMSSGATTLRADLKRSASAGSSSSLMLQSPAAAAKPSKGVSIASPSPALGTTMPKKPPPAPAPSPRTSVTSYAAALKLGVADIHESVTDSMSSALDSPTRVATSQPLSPFMSALSDKSPFSSADDDLLLSTPSRSGALGAKFVEMGPNASGGALLAIPRSNRAQSEPIVAAGFQAGLLLRSSHSSYSLGEQSGSLLFAEDFPEESFIQSGSSALSPTKDKELPMQSNLSNSNLSSIGMKISPGSSQSGSRVGSRSGSQDWSQAVGSTPGGRDRSASVSSSKSTHSSTPSLAAISWLASPSRPTLPVEDNAGPTLTAAALSLDPETFALPKATSPSQQPHYGRKQPDASGQSLLQPATSAGAPVARPFYGVPSPSAWAEVVPQGSPTHAQISAQVKPSENSTSGQKQGQMSVQAQLQASGTSDAPVAVSTNPSESISQQRLSRQSSPAPLSPNSYAQQAYQSYMHQQQQYHQHMLYNSELAYQHHHVGYGHMPPYGGLPFPSIPDPLVFQQHQQHMMFQYHQQMLAQQQQQHQQGEFSPAFYGSVPGMGFGGYAGTSFVPPGNQSMGIDGGDPEFSEDIGIDETSLPPESLGFDEDADNTEPDQEAVSNDGPPAAAEVPTGPYNFADLSLDSKGYNPSAPVWTPSRR